MTIQCCVCKKIKDGEKWKTDGHGGRSDASHTYCPRCFEKSMTALRAEQRRSRLARTVLA